MGVKPFTAGVTLGRNNPKLRLETGEHTHYATPPKPASIATPRQWMSGSSFTMDGRVTTRITPERAAHHLDTLDPAQSGFLPGTMLTLLHGTEAELPHLLRLDPTRWSYEIFTSYRPFTERVYIPWRGLEIKLHVTHPCPPETPWTYHSHGFFLAVRKVSGDGLMRMLDDPSTTHRIATGDAYEMCDARIQHATQPADGISLSVALTKVTRRVWCTLTDNRQAGMLTSAESPSFTEDYLRTRKQVILDTYANIYSDAAVQLPIG